ncbi:MAG: hypothetical protein EZS28_002935 [Streblomastix strix]|uniref:DNA mismatch repair protein MutS connector domain-containing protein n=1 Tax=Streblomastix strix TaxID=222440 RepID=A0A5J4X4U7_9EUKA|nr:MAG: hypothetical protein EZS28_002935 [Streblomastix strix]
MSESPQQADDDQIEIPNKEGVLALSLIKGRLGLASFDPSTNEIGFAEVADCDVFALLAMFIQELQPTQIIIPQNASVELVEALSRDSSCIGYKTIRTPPHTFSEDVARRYISMIRAGNHPCTRADRIVGQAANLQLVFDFRKQQMSRAMGALMSYLHKFPSMGADMNISQGIINVDSFRSINLQNIVRMEGSAFKGLEIFEREKHPSMHGTGITKEGMSIFSLIGSASLHSSKGIRMMRQWFNRPLCDIHLIKNEEIQIRGSKKGGIIHSIQHSLGSVRPLESIFLVLQRGEGRRTTFESLVKV